MDVTGPAEISSAQALCFRVLGQFDFNLRDGIDGKSDSDQKKDRLICCDVESNRYLSLSHGAIVTIFSVCYLQRRSREPLTRAANLLRGSRQRLPSQLECPTELLSLSPLVDREARRFLLFHQRQVDAGTCTACSGVTKY
jgi:hypothetical protein